MGCDIHSVAIDENGKPIDDGKYADGASANPEDDFMKDWGEGEPFGWRNYGVFAFLAGVRNYSGIEPISLPRGLPADIQQPDDDEFWLGDHSFSWLSISELEEFDYDTPMEDRRYTGRHPMGFISGAMTADVGSGQVMTWREFLGQSFFDDIDEMRRIGADRVAFGFDS